MSFFIYDLIFLVLFLTVFSVFLYTRKKNLKREGLLYLYRTSWGIKLINRIGKRHNKAMRILSWLSIISGYFLMAGMFYLVYVLVKIYFFVPEAVRAIKVPPIMPLVPYLPQVFKLEFLPPFYFTYWIVIIAILAITHEMAHGILAAYNKVRIKTTGFGFFPFFFPAFPLAFVELDEEMMQKKENFAQRAVLSAGTFANVLTGILFFGVLTAFFSFSFSAAGITYDTYATQPIFINEITSVNGINLNSPSYEELLELSGTSEQQLIEIKSGEETYLSTEEMISSQENGEEIFLYQSAPAIKENLSSIITKINGVPLYNIDDLVNELSKYSPGNEISITTISDEGIVEKTLVLEEHPGQEERAWLGIGFVNQEKGGLIGRIVNLASFKDPHVYYKPKSGEWSIFVYNLLWWLVIISISMALINMLPVGIFDGGRFFYLTVLALTKNKKIAKQSFMLLTKFFIFLFFLLIVFWGISWIR